MEGIKNTNNTIVSTPDEQWQQLDQYITNDPYLSKRRGQYAERNGGRTPWNHQIDAKFVYNTNIFKTRIEFSLDIFNISNLINPEWGTQSFVPNVSNSGFALLDFVKIENKKPVYQFNNHNKQPWLVDNFASRWQMQLGINLKF